MLNSKDGVPYLEDAVNFYHPEDRDKVSVAMQACIDTGEPFQFTLRLIRPNGLRLIVAAAGSKFLGSSAQAVRGVGTLRNVTHDTRQDHLLDQLQVLQRRAGQIFFSSNLVNDLPFWSPYLYDPLGLNPDR